MRTYVAAVADVDVERNSGSIRVKRFFVVHDCGQIVNPDGVKNQIEGNIVPDVVIELSDRPSEKPWGGGEPLAAIVPAAISDVVFDAVGARLCSVPFTPEKVKTAIEGAVVDK